MISAFQAIILGIVQGLTEFLPISSSAHLILVPLLFGWEQQGLTFDVALHAGTAVAVLLYFRNTWIMTIRAFFASLFERKLSGYPDRQLAWFIVLGTIPGGLAGALGEKIIEEKLRETWIIGVTMILLAILLFIADRIGKKQRTFKDLKLPDSILVGCAQAMALVPGVSRSGITITTGLFRDLNRTSAAEFSFLLSAPIIVGAALMKAVHVIRHPDMVQTKAGVFLAGFLTSAIVGFLCIKYFLRYLRSQSLLPFVIYRILLGVAILLFLRTHI